MNMWNVVDWGIAHPEWVMVCGLVLSAVQAVISTSRLAPRLRQLPPATDPFVIHFVVGLLITAAAGLIGLLASQSNAGLVSGLACGMLANMVLAVIAISRQRT